MNYRHLLLLTFFNCSFISTIAQDFAGVSYGPEDRQFVDIYLGESETPTPVYFDAHGNGGNTDLPSSMTNALTAEGISVVAWESLTSINTPEDVDTGWADAELMFQWVIDNAATYNFDPAKLIIGGSSRGSILSWKYGHRPNPNVLGLYMYNGLPDGIWANPDYSPLDEVTVESPEIFWVYRFEPGTKDIHDPENGMRVMDLYTTLGIGDRDTLIHSISSTNNTDRYQFLLPYALSLLDEGPSDGGPSDGDPSDGGPSDGGPGDDDPVVTSVFQNKGAVIHTYPNPVGNQLRIDGLTGDEHFVLTTMKGIVIKAGRLSETLQTSDLHSGIYMLSITDHHTHKVLRLVKD